MYVARTYARRKKRKNILDKAEDSAGPLQAVQSRLIANNASSKCDVARTEMRTINIFDKAEFSKIERLNDYRSDQAWFLWRLDQTFDL